LLFKVKLGRLAEIKSENEKTNLSGFSSGASSSRVFIFIVFILEPDSMN